MWISLQEVFRVINTEIQAHKNIKELIEDLTEGEKEGFIKGMEHVKELFMQYQEEE